MSLNSLYCYKCGTWKPGALSNLFRVNKPDKTITAKHWETSDREDELSECLLVMSWIVIEPERASSSQAKACLPSSGAFWQKALQNLLMEESK
jgi:hypothetical protein